MADFNAISARNRVSIAFFGMKYYTLSEPTLFWKTVFENHELSPHSAVKKEYLGWEGPPMGKKIQDPIYQGVIIAFYNQWG